MAFVLSKANIILPSADGSQTFPLHREQLVEVPGWAAETAYFKALVADGDIVLTNRSDKAVQDAADKPVRKKKTADWDKPAEPQEPADPKED